MRTVKPRGFTLLEMMVVLGIIAILLGLAVPTLMHSRPKATLDSVTTDLEGMLHSARQEALARGANVAVLVFPDYVADAGYRGRFFMIQDEPLPNTSFFDSATPPPDHSELRDLRPGQPDRDPERPASRDARSAAGRPGRARHRDRVAQPPLPLQLHRHRHGLRVLRDGRESTRSGELRSLAAGRPSTRSRVPPSRRSRTTAGGASISVFHELLTQSTTFVITKPQGVVRALHNG